MLLQKFTLWRRLQDASPETRVQARPGEFYTFLTKVRFVFLRLPISVPARGCASELTERLAGREDAPYVKGEV